MNRPATQLRHLGASRRRKLRRALWRADAQPDRLEPSAAVQEATPDAGQGAASSEAEGAAQESAAAVETEETPVSDGAAPESRAPMPELVAGPPDAGAPRRVAIFSSEAAHRGEESAVSSYVRESAAALGRAGNEVHVFMAGAGPATSSVSGVCHHFVGAPTSSDVVAAAGEFCENAVRAYRQEASLGGPFRVAHGYEWTTAAALRMCKKAGVPRTVVTFHSTEYQRAGQRFEGGISETISRAERGAAQAAERVVAVCEEVRQQLLWLYELPAEKVSTIHGGLSPQPPAGAADTAAARAAYGVGPEIGRAHV